MRIFREFFWDRLFFLDFEGVRLLILGFSFFSFVLFKKVINWWLFYFYGRVFVVFDL